MRLTEREGFAAASEGGRVVILDTRVDDGLRREGLAREVVNRIQGARKALDLAYDARIEITYAAEGELAEAIETHADYIKGETLTTELRAGEPDGEPHARQTEVEGANLTFAIRA